MPRMTRKPLDRLRIICLALPASRETTSHGAPTFWGGKRVFAMFASGVNHHGGGRDSVWCKAAPGNQELMVRADPHRFFVPPYVGPSGWIGVRLDTGVDWTVVAELMADAWRLVAPRKEVAMAQARAPLEPASSPSRRASAKRTAAARATPPRAAARPRSLRANGPARQASRGPRTR